MYKELTNQNEVWLYALWLDIGCSRTTAYTLVDKGRLSQYHHYQ
jgi:hypothetical protein